MTQLEKLRKLLGINNDEKDFILEFSLERIADLIKDYCHIDEVPAGLNSVMLNMAVDMYRSENLGAEDTPLGPITSIAEGNVSTSFANIKTSMTEGEKFLKNYTKQLNRYRKLVW
ncbi:hypothetical protein HNQ80_004838 [Anaerosolibacter carboniphilus]|uniref:Phage gp6-like head-tail connector protein n=1 Tax=Anaerosolibacter carboniphilus TaxID=1417629 RepID=A0A841KYG1_9FIRM|nr:phage head-tail connector protein [Anaerosolibacter carboniphilus]MBB6218664.1 hypothetical protein [Anaerosolibacter carboniphilus]